MVFIMVGVVKIVLPILATVAVKGSDFKVKGAAGWKHEAGVPFSCSRTLVAVPKQVRDPVGVVMPKMGSTVAIFSNQSIISLDAENQTSMKYSCV